MDISGFANQVAHLPPIFSGNIQIRGPAAPFQTITGGVTEPHARSARAYSEETGKQSGTAGQDPEARTGREITEEDLRRIKDLEKRDTEVKRHEQAHLAALGPYARGGASYEYTMGPDQKRYATGGEVPVDLSPVPGNPQATMTKAQAIQRAALAPSDPSAADRRVHAQAVKLEQNARRELSEKTQDLLGDLTKTSEVRRQEIFGEPESRRIIGKNRTRETAERTAGNAPVPVDATLSPPAGQKLDVLT